MTYEVGKFYKVPCVRGAWGSETYIRDWPVMGSLHEDGEIIKFPHQHYHIDWRFVQARIIGVDDGLDVLRRGRTFLEHQYAIPLITWARLNPDGLPPPVMRRRKCQRAHHLPFERPAITWMPKLEAAHATCKLTGLVCPHRGYDLSHEPVADDGTITCPMHGLRWNAFTGEPAPRLALGKGGFQ